MVSHPWPVGTNVYNASIDHVDRAEGYIKSVTQNHDGKIYYHIKKLDGLWAGGPATSWRMLKEPNKADVKKWVSCNTSQSEG